jgi:Family of unknown function (DUF5995)
MSISTGDQQLLQSLTGRQVATIPDVIATMEAIDQALSSSDGLKWFNLLYLMVTEQVNAPPAGWKAPSWIEHLDVVFARFYFNAITNSIQGATGVPSSWQALFEARFETGIDRIQFALAGMNAHINHDLALALLQTGADMGVTPLDDGPEHDDYESVNGLLETELPQALTFLATGILGEAAQDTGKIGRYLAIWNVRVARDSAWDFADYLRPLDPTMRGVALAIQDRTTGALGRSLLL